MTASATSSFSADRSDKWSRPSEQADAGTGTPFSVIDETETGSNSRNVDEPGVAAKRTAVRDPNVSPSAVRSRWISYSWTSTTAARVAASARVSGMTTIMPVRLMRHTAASRYALDMRALNLCWWL